MGQLLGFSLMVATSCCAWDVARSMPPMTSPFLHSTEEPVRRSRTRSLLRKYLAPHQHRLVNLIRKYWKTDFTRCQRHLPSHRYDRVLSAVKAALSWKKQ